MVRFSAFGFSKDNEVVIASPWNSTQTKEKGQDAFLVVNQAKNEYYLVQEEWAPRELRAYHDGLREDWLNPSRI